MAGRKHFLTATMPDGYVKRIGPTNADFSHYWRIVAALDHGGTEVFWGHTRSLAEARRKQGAAADAARTRGWTSHRFEIVAVERTPA